MALSKCLPQRGNTVNECILDASLLQVKLFFSGNAAFSTAAVTSGILFPLSSCSP